MAKYKPSDIVTAGGQTKTLADWAIDRGTPVQTILGRLKRNPSIEMAVTTPVSKSGGANKGKTADADVLVGDEVQRLLDAGNKSKTWVRDRALIVLAYRSGLRCTEILNLFPKDIDIANGTVAVHHGKGDKARVVALDHEAWSQIAEWIKLRDAWLVESTSPLFCNQQGKRISDRQVRAMFSRRAAQAGIDKHVHPHGMRRTMASEMASEGIPLVDISTILGHANIATTNTYVKKINPASALSAMRSRGWGTKNNNATNHVTSALPPPEWLDRLRQDIGERLIAFTDLRSDQNEFKALITLI